MLIYAKRRMGFKPNDDTVREHRALLITALFGGVYVPVNLVTTNSKFSVVGQLFSPALGTFLYLFFILFFFNL